MLIITKKIIKEVQELTFLAHVIPWYLVHSQCWEFAPCTNFWNILILSKETSFSLNSHNLFFKAPRLWNSVLFSFFTFHMVSFCLYLFHLAKCFYFFFHMTTCVFQFQPPTCQFGIGIILSYSDLNSRCKRMLWLSYFYSEKKDETLTWKMPFLCQEVWILLTWVEVETEYSIESDLVTTVLILLLPLKNFTLP